LLADRTRHPPGRLARVWPVFLLVLSTATGLAQTGSFDWSTVPELGSYPGIKRAYVAATSPRTMKINCLRIDTATPGLRFYSTPRSGTMETMTQTTRQFINAARSAGRNLVVAINATAWHNYDSSQWNQSKPADLAGLGVSKGSVVSPGEGIASFLAGKSGLVQLMTTGPGIAPASIDTAVTAHPAGGKAGFVLQNGVTFAGPYNDFDQTTNPRTAIGLSEDRRHVYFLTIDGRQSASAGACTWEAGDWLRYFGARHGINMDGGGSATMAWFNPAIGQTQLLNVPVGAGWFGSTNTERHNGDNIGVYYDPAPGAPPPVSAVSVSRVSRDGFTTRLGAFEFSAATLANYGAAWSDWSRSLLQFDLSGSGLNFLDVVSVKLRLTAAMVANTTGQPLEVHGIAVPWTGNAASAGWFGSAWPADGNGAKNIDFAGGVGATPAESKVITAPGVVEFDVTAMAMGWLADSSANHGILLRAGPTIWGVPDSPNWNIALHSSEAAVGRPELVFQVAASPPAISAARDGADLVLTWSDGVLQTSAELGGAAWTAVPGATSPLRVTPSEPRRFYRAVRPSP